MTNTRWSWPGLLRRVGWVLALLLTAAPAVGAEYELVWADEFDRDGPPNPAHWTYERGFVRNQELQWYQPQNAWCRDGRLVIAGRRERRRNPLHCADGSGWKAQRRFVDYTSASLTTKGLHRWQYGRFEVRAKIPAEEGLWPAIWFLGERGEWPSRGEIDLMEFYGGNVLANFCWGRKARWKPRWKSSKTPLSSLGGTPWAERFHVWRMDWDADRIALYVDDVLLNAVDLSNTVNPGGWGPENPFHQPHYLLLNLAIGGNSGGDPSRTVFPARYEVDYVRVYQKR